MTIISNLYLNSQAGDMMYVWWVRQEYNVTVLQCIHGRPMVDPFSQLQWGLIGHELFRTEIVIAAHNVTVCKLNHGFYYIITNCPFRFLLYVGEGGAKRQWASHLPVTFLYGYKYHYMTSLISLQIIS